MVLDVYHRLIRALGLCYVVKVLAPVLLLTFITQVTLEISTCDMRLLLVCFMFLQYLAANFTNFYPRYDSTIPPFEQR